MLDSIIDDLVLGEDEFQQVSDLVYQHCGINLHEGKKELVRARLAKRLRILKIKSFSDVYPICPQRPDRQRVYHADRLGQHQPDQFLPRKQAF